ncbi:hypothetical protein Bbelb_005550 [Branchiostoma belcheri]|nr:hypothetical protein Bbelb_005550 [Branchiostoma belcheri]
MNDISPALAGPAVAERIITSGRDTEGPASAQQGTGSSSQQASGRVVNTPGTNHTSVGVRSALLKQCGAASTRTSNSFYSMYGVKPAAMRSSFSHEISRKQQGTRGD